MYQYFCCRQDIATVPFFPRELCERGCAELVSPHRHCFPWDKPTWLKHSPISRHIWKVLPARSVSTLARSLFAILAEPFCSTKFTRCYHTGTCAPFIHIYRTVARGDELVVPDADICTNYDFFSCQQFFDSLVDG